ncbi:zinc-binding dehydrogenase [Streptomyces sp. NPDC059909]|uniref:zinc-dependent alcohol dehydrogenase n=1 Tax=Streptomyces sp. NPDC059909 TaxID=3346998 RepID=UPI00364C9D76
MSDTVVSGPPSEARASVALPGARSELRSLPLHEAGPGEGWLQVTASGICGTDVSLFAKGVPEPTVLGHHVVGRIAAVAPEQGERTWQGRVGDRVVIEEYLPCGTCPSCTSGAYRLCPQTDLWGGGRRVGTLPAAEASGLHGGNAEYLLLQPNTVVHPLPPELSEELAAWVLPYANALDWTLRAGAVRKGETVVIVGPGYHGLAVAAAARYAGAETVVAGLRRDRTRLEIAERLGAVTVAADTGTDLAEGVRRVLGSRAADCVVDAVGAAPHVVRVAVDLLGQGGRLVLTTPKQPAAVPVDTSAMIRRNVRISAVRGRRPEYVRQAIASLADGTSGLQELPSVEVSLEETGDMLARLAAGTGPKSPHVVVRP